MTNFFLKGSYN